MASVAEQPAKQAGGHGAGEDADLRRDADIAHHQTADVARGAEEGGVAEGKQAGKAEQQIESAGEQRVAEDFHQKGRVHRERGDQTDHEQGAEQQWQFAFPDSWSSSCVFPSRLRTCRTGRPAGPAGR
jgi:hypothetical protein